MKKVAKTSTPKVVVIDFETLPIEDRPRYPPLPVGVSIRWPGKESRYWGFGHVTGNNCTWGEARRALVEAYASSHELLFQNEKFDVDVAEVHFGLPVPDWERLHDTMLLLFLDDPHQRELGLKPSAERLLGLPPEEKDAVEDWLLENQPVPGVKISRSKQSEHYFMKYLGHAPGTVVGPYADGDVDRTHDLFQLLYPKTVERGMLRAYDRERELAPILLDMERQGVPVDLKRLDRDVESYIQWTHRVEEWIVRRLRAPADINLASGEQLIDAMIKASKVDTDLMPRTATGKYATNKDALLVGVKDRTLLAMLKYRAQLHTCLTTFMIPWLRMARASGGLIFTTWNQTRSAEGAGTVGTRTGRLSATWFMNIPKDFVPVFRHEETDAKKAKALVACPFDGLPALPSIRSYVVPFEGDVLIDRDYSQQEPRILAHFEGGALLDQYLANPWIDFHDNARDELERIMKRKYARRPVKNINLGLIYGQGVGSLAVKNDSTVDETKELKNAILAMYPGLKDMQKDMKVRARTNEPIRTWGGREYYCEQPKIIDGRLRTFDYKLVNVLVQGSAADCTKEAIIRYYRRKKKSWKLILNVHDQLTSSVPAKDRDEAMEVKRQVMEGIEFDVPMLSEGSTSEENWASLKDYDKKGRRVDGH